MMTVALFAAGALHHVNILEIVRHPWFGWTGLAIIAVSWVLAWSRFAWFRSYAKWVYAVPFVHDFQVWEMPLIGFAGYLPFGVECAAVTYWLYDAFGLNAEPESGGESA